MATSPKVRNNIVNYSYSILLIYVMVLEEKSTTIEGEEDVMIDEIDEDIFLPIEPSCIDSRQVKRNGKGRRVSIT